MSTSTTKHISRPSAEHSTPRRRSTSPSLEQPVHWVAFDVTLAFACGADRGVGCTELDCVTCQDCRECAEPADSLDLETLARDCAEVAFLCESLAAGLGDEEVARRQFGVEAPSAAATAVTSYAMRLSARVARWAAVERASQARG